MKALLISPYFPPYNTADMQRIRMSLPHYAGFDWEVEIVTVHEPDNDTSTDDLLVKSIPKNTIIHYVKAFTKKTTAKFGLGSIALRSLYFYRKEVNKLLKANHYDLIYFSTTQFPLCILGAYWKRKFGVPFVIDMQDPWHSDYYEDKPKHQRPKKYWFSYYLNKYLEPIAMNAVDGLIAVSEKYILDLQVLYPRLKQVPTKVITFGYSDVDFEISKHLAVQHPLQNQLHLVYVGVLGQMMQKSLNLFFDAMKQVENFKTDYYLSFKGTSYANAAQAQQTALPIATTKGIFNIAEDPKRLGIFEVLSYLSHADGLLIFGTDDPGYTSSKLYPYLQTEKPILGIFHPESNAIEILSKITNAQIIKLTDDEDTVLTKVLAYLEQIKNNTYQVDQHLLNEYSAQEMTRKQCELFNLVIAKK